MRTSTPMLAALLLLPTSVFAQQTGGTRTDDRAGTPAHHRTGKALRNDAKGDIEARLGTIGTGQVGSGATTTTTPDTVPSATDTLGRPGTTLGTGSTVKTNGSLSNDAGAPN